MHELQVTESILNIVLKHAPADKVKKIVAIHLNIGELSDLENEWIQQYFDYLSKDTLAEGAKLIIERIPIRLKCDSCQNEFEIKRDEIKNIECRRCGNKKCSLIAGRDYFIKNMEVI